VEHAEFHQLPPLSVDRWLAGCGRAGSLDERAGSGYDGATQHEADQGGQTMQIKKGYKQLLAEANAEIETLSPEQAIALQGQADVVFVDLRDPREMDREGKLPGAFACTRGMLEFWIDPESPYHKPIFAEDRRFVFFCAGGWRSALAAKTAQDMGLENVAHIDGGFGAWKKAGGATEPPKPRS
jgi:rhodanese-related sulfurtransferase